MMKNRFSVLAGDRFFNNVTNRQILKFEDFITKTCQKFEDFIKKAVKGSDKYASFVNISGMVIVAK